jgi:hypothetical protein
MIEGWMPSVARPKQQGQPGPRGPARSPLLLLAAGDRRPSVAACPSAPEELEDLLGDLPVSVAAAVQRDEQVLVDGQVREDLRPWGA